MALRSRYTAFTGKIAHGPVLKALNVSAHAPSHVNMGQNCIFVNPDLNLLIYCTRFWGYHDDSLQFTDEHL